MNDHPRHPASPDRPAVRVRLDHALVTLASAVGFACGSRSAGPAGSDRWQGNLPELAPYQFVIDERELQEVDDPADLMGRIVPLRDSIGDGPSCTGATIADGVVLTAAHCLAPGRTRYAGEAAMHDGPQSRDCRGGTCAEGPTGTMSEWDFRRDDIGAVVMRDPLPTGGPIELLDIPGGGDLPPIFLASALRARPLLACKLTIVFGGGQATGTTEPGDSGSPLFVVEPDRAPSVLGVVSGRSAAHQWYFAPVEPLPWPSLADALARPEVQHRTVDIVDPRCPS